MLLNSHKGVSNYKRFLMKNDLFHLKLINFMVQIKYYKYNNMEIICGIVCTLLDPRNKILILKWMK